MRKRLAIVIFWLGMLPILQLVLAVINPYSFFPISNQVIFLSITHSIFFYLSAWVALQVFKVGRTVNLNADTFRHISRSHIILTIGIFVNDVIIFLFSLLFMLRSGISLQDARDTFFFDNIYGTKYTFGELVILIWIIQALRMFMLIRITAAFFVFPNQRNIILFVLISGSFILTDLSTGGRINTFYFATIVISIMLLMGWKAISLVSKKVLMRVASVGSLTLAVVTATRLEAGHSAWYFLYKYFIGPLFILNAAIDDPGGLLYDEKMRFGATFFGLDWAIVGTAKLFGCDCQTLATILDPIMRTGYWFSNDDGANAFFTGFFPFILDFGVLGPVLSGMIFGLGVVYFASRYSVKGDIKSFSLAVVFVFACTLIIRENIIPSPWMLMAIFLLMVIDNNGAGKKKRLVAIPSG